MVLNATIEYYTHNFWQTLIVQSCISIFGFFALVGNSVIILAYIKFDAFRKLDCSLMVVGLAGADFLTGVGLFLVGLTRLNVILLKNYNFTRFYCIETTVPYLVGLCMSQAFTAAIAIDRLIAISSPIAYRSLDRRRFFAVSFAVAIAYGSCMIVFSLVGIDFSVPGTTCSWGGGINPLSLYATEILELIFAVVIVIIYPVILIKQRTMSQRYAGATGQMASSAAEARQTKMTRTLTKLVIVNIIFIFIPSTINLILAFFNIPVTLSSILNAWQTCSESISVAVNILLYAQTNSLLRPFIVKLLTGDKASPVGSSNHGPITQRSPAQAVSNSQVFGGTIAVIST